MESQQSGALKPVVNIETVDTGDCNMENPTGYNAGWIYNHHIAPGAKILVTRSGGVIPKILETITPPVPMDENRMWHKIHQCPHCGQETKFDEKEIELYCSNPECPGIKLAKMVFFFTTVAPKIWEKKLSPNYLMRDIRLSRQFSVSLRTIF